ncbi:hypothetical protein AOLI_G00281790 [Acnodon oligacanthus]
MPALSALPPCALARVRVGRLGRAPQTSPCGSVLPCAPVGCRTALMCPCCYGRGWIRCEGSRTPMRFCYLRSVEKQHGVQ